MNGRETTSTVGPVGRKRSNSVVEKLSNKSLKSSHSPVPNPRVVNIQEVTSRNNVNSRKQCPDFNLPVVAATILYAAWEHVDHWPVLFVKAYAEDCFGPRLWVDHPLCSLFAANLALIQDDSTTFAEGATDSTVGEVPVSLSAEAATVSDFYRTFDVFLSDQANDGTKSLYEGLVSLDSSDTDCGSRQNAGLTHIQKNPTATSTSSDCGQEEEKTPRRQQHDKEDSETNGSAMSGINSSSVSNGEGEIAHLGKRARLNGVDPSDVISHSTSSNDDAFNGLAPGNFLDTVYPLVQKSVQLQRVRPRFVGTNCLSGYEAIAAAFSDRLDVRSKQNSSLLQSLPSFTTIPRVRSLIASNLEKWLQSPALAGLARTLFSSTVNHMKRVDPPLLEDLMAIDSIIGMRLKANQVRLTKAPTQNRILWSSRSQAVDSQFG